MEKICDLHTHSTYSDGTYTPAELIEAAIAAGLSAVALCDHNTVDGIPALLAAAKGRPIEAVAGAEFSVDYEGKELHLLGLMIAPPYLAQVTELMQAESRRKEESNIALVEALRKGGYWLDYDQIKRDTPNGRVNRAHIAKVLVQKGYVGSIDEAFRPLLAPGGSYYKPPRRISVWEMLDHISAIRAVPVLAHPFLNLTEEELAAFLPIAKSRGLVGMECQYPLYNTAQTARALQMAAQFALKPSGGSDFHGAVKPDIQIGVGRGALRVPYAWFSALAAG